MSEPPADRVAEEDGSAEESWPATAEARDVRLQQVAESIRDPLRRLQFLSLHGLRHTSFRICAGLADDYRDAKNWLDAYLHYVRALDQLPDFCPYVVQAGHCLKEMGLFGAAELYYRSALLLGGEPDDITPHLLHCCYQRRAYDSIEALIARRAAVLAEPDPMRRAPTLNRILRVARTLDLLDRLSMEDVLEIMRRGISTSEVLAELANAYAGHVMRPLEAMPALPGMPRVPGSAASGLVAARDSGLKGRSGGLSATRRSMHRLRTSVSGFRRTAQPVALRWEFRRPRGETSSRAGAAALTSGVTGVAIADRIDMTSITLMSSADHIRIDLTSTRHKERHVAYGADPEQATSLRVADAEVMLLVWLKDPLGDLTMGCEVSIDQPIADVECWLSSSQGHHAVVRFGDLVAGTIRLTRRFERARAPSVCDGLISTAGAANVSLRDDIKPEVSVVILNRNRPCVTALAILSTNTITCPYEVILVENGSRGVQQVDCDKMPPLRRLVLDVNAKFGGGNNCGAAQARGAAILLLNNDAFLAPDAVDCLLLAMRLDPACGVAGPVFRYPDGVLQEAGAFVDGDGNTTQRGKFDRAFVVADLPAFAEVDYVSAACLMIRRDLFQTLGGFDADFNLFGYYDDVDLCMRVRAAGAKVLLARDALCYHVEGMTNSRAPQRTDGGRQLFAARWADPDASERGKMVTSVANAQDN